jgi:hypothetical protein
VVNDIDEFRMPDTHLSFVIAGDMDNAAAIGTNDMVMMSFGDRVATRSAGLYDLLNKLLLPKKRDCTVNARLVNRNLLGKRLNAKRRACAKECMHHLPARVRKPVSDGGEVPQYLFTCFFHIPMISYCK